ncbi:hypothetical protein RND71_010486 [Anisodus tanguticus]|uniref:Uncharacterized protein n=1 Tax=Anisodus tanguticus TaxID=243964 RepID=A0AAE1SJX0_9SOLA|nr:hypothetical protein RND71_010486 [Anisodus tanguticus]
MAMEKKISETSNSLQAAEPRYKGRDEQFAGMRDQLDSLLASGAFPIPHVSVMLISSIDTSQSPSRFCPQIRAREFIDFASSHYLRCLKSAWNHHSWSIIMKMESSKIMEGQHEMAFKI